MVRENEFVNDYVKEYEYQRAQPYHKPEISTHIYYTAKRGKEEKCEEQADEEWKQHSMERIRDAASNLWMHMDNWVVSRIEKDCAYGFPVNAMPFFDETYYSTDKTHRLIAHLEYDFDYTKELAGCIEHAGAEILDRTNWHMFYYGDKSDTYQYFYTLCDAATPFKSKAYLFDKRLREREKKRKSQHEERCRRAPEVLPMAKKIYEYHSRWYDSTRVTNNLWIALRGMEEIIAYYEKFAR